MNSEERLDAMLDSLETEEIIAEIKAKKKRGEGRNYLDAFKVTSKDEAESYLSDLIAQIQVEDPVLNYAETRALVLSNIGYSFGYLGEESLARALELYP